MSHKIRVAPEVRCVLRSTDGSIFRRKSIRRKTFKADLYVDGCCVTVRFFVGTSPTVYADCLPKHTAFSHRESSGRLKVDQQRDGGRINVFRQSTTSLSRIGRCVTIRTSERPEEPYAPRPGNAAQMESPLLPAENHFPSKRLLVRRRTSP
jgi:hypothetical protein